MNPIKYISLIVIFLTSCSSDLNEGLEANLLISPDYQFTTQFFECKLNEGFNLISLESFLSDLVKEDSNNKTKEYDISRDITAIISLINYRLHIVDKYGLGG